MSEKSTLSTFIIVILIILPFLIAKLLIGKKKNRSKNKISKVSNKSKMLFTTSLPVAFWGFFIGGNIILNTLMHISKQEFVMFLMIVHLIQIIISVYLIFRNAEFFKQQRIKYKENYGQATAAKIATALIVLASIGNIMIAMSN